jgi:PAS domain S-box-containing protein
LLSQSLITLPALDRAIDCDPLIVSPETPLLEVLQLMRQGQSEATTNVGGAGISRRSLSYALVMSDTHLLGIFTERDVVRLTAAERSLDNQTVADVMTRSMVCIRRSDIRDVVVLLEMMQQHHVRHLPVLDETDQVLGVATAEGVRMAIKPMHLLRLRRIDEAMTTKVVHASPTTSILALAKLMALHRVSCIVVVADCGEELTDPSPQHYPIGIVTERDVVQFQLLQLDLANVQARKVMSAPLLRLRPSDTLWDAQEAMQQMRVRRLVVTGDNGSLLGIITQSSILRSLNPLELYRMIETLQNQVQEKTIQLETALREKQELARLLTAQEAQANLPEEKLRQVFQGAIAAINEFRVFPDGRLEYLYLSPGCEAVFGYTIEELRDDPLLWESRLFPEDLPYASMRRLATCFPIPSPLHLEYRFWHKDGSLRWIADTLNTRWDESDSAWKVTTVGRDVTQRKQLELELQQLNQALEQRVLERTLELQQTNRELEAEIAERQQVAERLNVLLREKEVLLQEVHHRVNNNLQIISSLLRMQSTQLADHSAAIPLQEARSRVQAMALIHDQLYRSSNFSAINVDEYIDHLVKNLQRSHRLPFPLNLTLDIKAPPLPLDVAIPCGLLINELVSNALKYAFVDRTSGDLCIQLSPEDSSVMQASPQLTLTVSDNGIGIPPELNWKKTETVGLQLAVSLAYQLGGTLILDRANGTAFHLTFSLPSR